MWDDGVVENVGNSNYLLDQGWIRFGLSWIGLDLIGFGFGLEWW